MNTTIKTLRLRVLLALLACPAYAFAATPCTDNFDGTFTCSGASENAYGAGGTMYGATTLDNASGPVTLDNIGLNVLHTIPFPPFPTYLTTDGLIVNDQYAPGYPAILGPIYTIQTNGGANSVVINNASVIQVDRSSDPDNMTFHYDAFVADGAGHLLYNDIYGNTYNGNTPSGPVAVGVAAAIYADANTASLTVNNLATSDALGPLYGNIIADPYSPSAAIYSNSPLVTINNQANAGITNDGAYYDMNYLDVRNNHQDTLGFGHWSIATWGQGLTILNGDGGRGDLLMVDRNPLMMMAQRDNPGLVLAYDAGDVGVRDSVITMSGLDGSIYLGSGAHTINNAGVISGDIFVDQTGASTTDAAGNILTTVHGARQFTFNNTGTMYGYVYINDVAGAVNVLNYSLGGGGGTDIAGVFANGLGNNTVNAVCYSGTCSAGNFTGITTLNMSGTGAILDETIQLTGDANLNATLVKLGGSLTAANVNIGSGSTLSGDTSNSIGAINGNLASNGATIDLGTATLNVSGNASFNTGSSIHTTLGAGSYGRIVLGGTGTIANGVTLVPTVSGTSLTNGQTFTIATNTTGLPTVTNGTGLFQWSVSNSGGNLVLGVHLGIPSFLAPTVSQAATNVTDFLVNYHGINADLLKLNSELMALTGAEVKRHVERLRPEIHDGALRLAMSGSDRLMGIIESRLFSLQYTGPRAAAGPAGIASGDSLSVQPGVWAQGYAFDGAQESTRIYDGYSIAATGMAFGADRLFGDSERLRVGGAFSYASGKVDNTGYTDVNRINIGSYFATAYTAWAGDPWYVNGALGVGRHTYDTQRSALGRSADGSHDAWQLGARLDAGWPLAVNDSLTLVPAARLSYSRLDESAYDEHGSIIALQIDGRTTESLRGGLGGRALYTLQEEDWLAALELRAMLNHEFGDVAQDSTARFVAGGSSFASPGVRPARDSLLLGGSIRLTGDDDQDQLSLLLNYDSELRERYFSQALSMTLRYDFDQGPAFRQQAEARKALTSAKSGVATAAPSVTVTERDVAAIQQAITGTDAGSVRRQQAVADALYAWVNAMANKNVEVYFNSYAADFVTPDGGSRQAWERKRKTELARGGSSAIKVSYLTIKPSGSRASAVFTQTAAIGDSKEVTLKSVDFAEKNGRWLIVREDGMAVPE